MCYPCVDLSPIRFSRPWCHWGDLCLNLEPTLIATVGSHMTASSPRGMLAHDDLGGTAITIWSGRGAQSCDSMQAVCISQESQLDVQVLLPQERLVFSAKG